MVHHNEFKCDIFSELRKDYFKHICLNIYGGYGNYFSIPETIEEPECKKPRQDENEICEKVTFRVNFKCPACFRKRLNIKVVLILTTCTVKYFCFELYSFSFKINIKSFTSHFELTTQSATTFQSKAVTQPFLKIQSETPLFIPNIKFLDILSPTSTHTFATTIASFKL